MKVDENGDRINPDQEIIDRMIDWRKLNRPDDTSDMRTSLSPKALHQCLGRSLPVNPKDLPDSVLYRGYRLLAKVKVKESA